MFHLCSQNFVRSQLVTVYFQYFFYYQSYLFSSERLCVAKGGGLISSYVLRHLFPFIRPPFHPLSILLSSLSPISISFPPFFLVKFPPYFLGWIFLCCILQQTVNFAFGFLITFLLFLILFIFYLFYLYFIYVFIYWLIKPGGWGLGGGGYVDPA